MEVLCNLDSHSDMGNNSDLETSTEDTQILLDRKVFEPEPDAFSDAATEYPVINGPEQWTQAREDTKRLHKLATEIKARAQVPVYEKLARAYPARQLTIVEDLQNTILDPIYYFQQLWTLEVWATLVDNTNKYAEFRGARCSQNHDRNGRWWTPVNLYKMKIFIALLLYISYTCIDSVNAYWSNSNTIHKPTDYMSYIRFEQIQRYLHIIDPNESDEVASTWYGKLWPLFNILRQQFQAHVVPGQNISFDEIMVLFTSRSSYILKMKNKLVGEGFKIWALCDSSYT